MKIVNKKGFILVETLIVTVFVATLFIMVYQNVVPYIGEYENLITFDDIDSVYASNLYKEMLTRYANTDYIDTYLQSQPYLDITDCNDNRIYQNAEYCQKLKKSLNILEDDSIFLTEYNISKFREEVKKNEMFDSGKLSSFRSYINTISDTDSFYNTSGENNNLVGQYRLFLTRTVPLADQSTSLHYVNLGIYNGKYRRYTMGEEVNFNPGDGIKKFYVLKNSSSFEDKVTLILANNVGTITDFNASHTYGSPDKVLNILKTNTDFWTNVTPLTSDTTFVSENGYTISYDGYRSRLLEPKDIYAILGLTIEENLFSTNSLFSIPIEEEQLAYLSDGLTDHNGYWMANMVVNNEEMAWTIQKNLIAPEFTDNTTNIGVRPVIVVEKEKLG